MIQGDMSIEDLLDDSSLNDLRTLFIHELMTAKGTEKLDFLVPELLPMTIKFAVALRTGHPKDFRHGCFPRVRPSAAGQ
jgi:hypothetical protein